MTDKQKPLSLACFLWEAWENNFPSSLLPIPSPAIKRSRVVSPDALQRKSHVRRTVSLTCAALHSSLSTPGAAETALVKEKSPCLTSRGCQPTPFGLCAEAGFVPQAVGCWPCCVCALCPDRRATAPLSFCQWEHTEPFSKQLTLNWFLADRIPKGRGKLLSFCTPAMTCFLAPDSLRGKSFWKWKELEERTTVCSWSLPQSLLMSRQGAARAQGRLQSLLQAQKWRRCSISSLFPLLTFFLLIF